MPAFDRTNKDAAVDDRELVALGAGELIAAVHDRPWAVKEQVMHTLVALASAGIGIAEHARGALQAATPAARGTGGPVAVLSLCGLITPQPSFLSLLFGGAPGGLIGFRESFEAAVADADIAAILIQIDSPGGLVDLVPETAAVIRDARGSKPIVAIADTMAASAAYWLASQADEVVVTPSGEVGSIGVFTAHRDISEMQAQIGVKTTLISAGRYKTEGNPFEPLSDEAKAAIQDTVDEMYGMFVSDVAAGRGTDEQAVRDGYGQGRMLTARRAVEEGLADRVATFEDTLARLMRPDSPSSGTAAARLAQTTAEAPADEPDDEDNLENEDVEAQTTTLSREQRLAWLDFAS